jgi:hypothetical protein
MEATFLTQAFNPEKLPAGLYVALSDTEAYALLQAMAAHGMGKLEGERYEPGGVKAVAVRVSGGRRVRRNAEEWGEEESGVMEAGPEFFVAAIRDYAIWQAAWWREAIQNSVDAGATKVLLSTKEQPDGTILVECVDNGAGMDRETLTTKFLRLGVSTKKQGQTAGGFGEAKRLLLLPWIEWQIETRSFLAEGAGTAKRIKTRQEGAAFPGTRLSVRMPADNHTSIYWAHHVLDRCNLPRVTFMANGKPVSATRSSGRVIREFAKAKAYHNKSSELRGMFVRTHGIYMFERDISNDVRGAVFIELTVPSIEVLSSSRDGIRDAGLRKEIDQLANDLASDPTSTVKKKTPNEFIKPYRGSGLLDADRSTSVVLAEMPPLPMNHGKVTQITTEASFSIADTIIEVLQEAASRRPVEDESKTKWTREVSTVDKDTASLILENTPIMGQQHLENVTKQLVWQPDFLLDYQVEEKKIPAKYVPATMTPMVLRLAKTWAEICRYVLVQLNYSGKYGIGFIVSNKKPDPRWSDEATVIAEYSNFEGDHWLLINPLAKIDDFGSMLVDMDSRDLSPAKDRDLKLLYAAAVHECTHMVDGVAKHNEIFGSAITKNMAICADGFRVARKIAALVGKRQPKEPSEQPQPKTREKETTSEHIKEYITGVMTRLAAAAAYYVHSKSGSFFLERYFHTYPADEGREYAQTFDALFVPYGDSTSALFEVLMDLSLHGRAALDQYGSRLKVDVGATQRDIVVIYTASTEAGTEAYERIRGACVDVPAPEYGTEVQTYTVCFE